MLSSKTAKIFIAAVTVFLITGIAGFKVFTLSSPNSEDFAKPLISSSNLIPQTIAPQVLSQTTSSATPLMSPRITSLVKGKLTICLLGDSMIDTLGNLEILKADLTALYPNVEFNLLNYGIGATKPDDGLKRLTEERNTPTKHLPAMLSQKPNIVIVETFSYNHGANTPEEINNHYQILGEIIKKLRGEAIMPVLMITIAPNRQNYAKGAAGIVWDDEKRRFEAETVISYLKAGFAFAKQNNLIIIDAFTPSLDVTVGGKQIYINSGDNIHPSVEGIKLISQITADKLFGEKIVEKTLH